MVSSNLPTRIPSLGSLTGFVSNPQEGKPDLTQTGWSIDQLKQFLTNEGDQNFITREWALLVNQIIQDHMADTTNPHEVTLDQVTPSVIFDVLSRIVPGTPPVSEPAFALDPGAELPFIDMVPATHNLTNCLRLTSTQTFKAPEPRLTTDYLMGDAGWALFSNLTDVLNDNWVTSQDTDLNGQVVSTMHPSVVWDFPFWSVSERNTIGKFGVSLPTTTQVGKVYTVQFFLKGIAPGQLCFYNKATPLDQAVYDLDNEVINSVDPDVRLVVIPQIEDLFLISFTFKAVSTQTTIWVEHRDNNQPQPVREGKNNRLLFLIGKPIAVAGSGPVPLPVSENSTWGTSPLIPDLARVGTPTSLAEFTLNLHFYLYPGLEGEQVDTTLFTMGPLSITRTSLEWQLKLAGVTVQSRPLLEGYNSFTISYSADTVIAKSTADERREYKAAYGPIQTTNVQIGPCGGYLLGFYLYPFCDRSRTVEFLTNA